MENAKISAKDFVDTYKSLDKNEDKKELIKGIIVRRYVPIMNKAGMADQIVSLCGRKNGILNSNSLGLYLSYVLGVIQLYTNLDVKNEKFYEDYDLLQEEHLIDIIFAEIGEDLKEFQTVLNMYRDDFEKNNYSIVGGLGATIDAINKAGQMLSENPDFRKAVMKEN